MARKFRKCCAALWVGIAAGVVWTTCAAQAANVPLLPHHAVYRLTLVSSSGNKAPAEAHGLITYDFSGSACTGYKTEFRQVTALEPSEGEARVSDTQTVTMESGDASTFDFNIQTTVNQGDPDDVKGEARHEADGALAVALVAPDSTKVTLNGDALFPTEHLARIIETARSGGRILSASVFDGSDTGQKIFNTLSVIGAPITAPASEMAAQDEALKAERRWPVTISYFEQSKTDAQPAYVLSFELYENGVSRALKVDYGSFALAGELTEFKPGHVATCEK